MAQLHNIFSNKIEKTTTKIIIADNREKNALVISELRAKNIIVRLEQLEVGDYLVGNTIIERKTTNDFESAILDGRLFEQLKNLTEHDESIVIVEKNENSYTRLHPNAIRGAILSIAKKWHIPLIFTLNEKETAEYLALLAKKEEMAPPKTRVKRIVKTPLEEKQFILEGLPGIGPATANKLLKEFNTIKNIVNASEKDLARVIGKSAKKVYEVINLPTP
jgi:ERCC4-type nuclease